MEQTCKTCNTTKPRDDFYRDARKKSRLAGQCRACWNARRRGQYEVADKALLSSKRRELYRQNPTRIREQSRASRNRNRQAALERDRRYARDNAERKRAAAAAWRAADPERVKRCARNARIKNAARVYAANKKRAAQQIRALPKWADLNAIQRLYRDAKALSDATGKPWHVDHIVPLRSGAVCGLHCEQNLQVISGDENIKKANKWWPDMPEVLHSDYPQHRKRAEKHSFEFATNP